MIKDILKDLNIQQLKAVCQSDGPLVILAGAGSGKTRILVYKVVYLITEKKVPPSQIVMITFTNKAANEMKKRIAGFFDKSTVRLGYIGTFHSFCCYILRRDGQLVGLDRNFVIYDTDDQEKVVKQVARQSGFTTNRAGYFLDKISEAKNRLIKPEKYCEFYNYYQAAQVAEVYFQYQKFLRKNLAVDFDDILLRAVELFQNYEAVLQKYQKRYSYILVDEFQDTNMSQYAFVSLLAKQKRNITVVGDFSQSIYSWRGADIRNLERFQSDFPDARVIYLERNYRSSQKILDFAYKVISANQTHPILKLYTKNGDGDDVIFHQAENEQEEAVYVASMINKLYLSATNYSDIAVLYRTNAQSRVIEEAFLHYGIPYMLVGGTRFYERKEIKDVLAYLRLIINPADEISQDRISKLGKQRFKQFSKLLDELRLRKNNLTTLEIMDRIFQQTGYLEIYNQDLEEDYARLENIKELRSVAANFPRLSQFLEQVALVESEYFQGEKRSLADSIRLMTLHQAKGLEFDYVFIVGVEEGILPHSHSLDDLFKLEEERRLFYVGITRAKKQLYITFARWRMIFGRRGEYATSRFITESVGDYYSENF